MKKCKGINGNILFSIGVLIFSISFLLDDFFSNNICEFIAGFGVGTELVGLIKMFIDNRNN